MTETDLFSPVVEIESEVAPPARTETANVDAPVLASMTLPTPEATVLHAAPKDDTPSPETVSPLQPPRSVALYIDGDNQSPAIARDLLASLRHDWGLEVSRVVLAGNDHGHTVPRWLTALADEALPEDRILALRVPRKPEAADLALILELGAAMERHRQGPDLVVVVSRDEWLIGAAEAVRARGCRVWVAYAGVASENGK